MKLQSNWGIMQKWLGQGDGTELYVVQGKVRIKARLFSVKMEFTSDIPYSESKTISVSVRPSDQVGILELNYMYINYTQVPVATDTNVHTGAARVFVKESGDDFVMDGTYFTDVAPAGNTKVTVETPTVKVYKPAPGTPPMPEGMLSPAYKRQGVPIPRRYARPETSELELQVKSGEQTFDIDIKD